MSYRLVMTSGACPEQYDVFLGEERVGYLRLRSGGFRADVPECGGITVYAVHVGGPGGIFEDDERDFYLQQAVNAIQTYRIGHGLSVPPPPADTPFEVSE